MAIVAGMPGANRTQISQGFQRILNTDPFEFTADPLPTFSFEVPEDDRLNHAAPTAVLVDYSTTSAADFFVWGAKEFSDAIVVGTPGTANYGFGGLGAVVVGGLVAELAYRNDPLQSRMMDGTPLEGVEVIPDIVVEYDPSDLAGGVDTVLEAAVEALLSSFRSVLLARRSPPGGRRVFYSTPRVLAAACTKSSSASVVLPLDRAMLRDSATKLALASSSRLRAARVAASTTSLSCASGPSARPSRAATSSTACSA